MELAKLTEWNPWWEDETSVCEISGVPRPDYAQLLDSLNSNEVTIITGVRRSGKSTLMYQMVQSLLERGTDPEDILFVNLEDKRLTGDGLDAIYECYRQNMNPDRKAYVFLDEIHRRDGWESWIRRHYDLKTNVKFVLSGSCSYLLKREYSTLLTGRNLTFEVFPLSFREYLSFRGAAPRSLKAVTPKTRFKLINILQDYMALGGFPGVLQEPERFRVKLLEQYFDDMLYKDMIDRYGLNSRKAKDLGLFLSTNFTSPISLRNVRQSLGLSYDTIKDYLAYFKEAFVFFTLEAFSYSLGGQKAQPPKVYCIDNGLRNAASFKFSRDEGRLAENLVFVELKRRGLEVFYWKNSNEVDFVLKSGDGSLEALNVTYSDDVAEREIKGLLEFAGGFPQARRLTLITKDTEKTEGRIRVIPLWRWLLA